MPCVVTAALAWFDEPLETLEECILSLEGVVDRVLAVDGAYARVSADSDVSPANQARLILDCSEKIGARCDLVVPRKRWAGQVAKRDFMMRRAAKRSDWILVVDADYVLCGDTQAAREEIESVPLSTDVIQIRFFTPPNPDVADVWETAATSWHVETSGQWWWLPLMPRGLPDFRVMNHHWWYAARGSDGEIVWIWGEGDAYRQTTRRHTLAADMWIEHRCLFRDRERVLRNRDFCADREGIVAATGQEDDPGVC